MKKIIYLFLLISLISCKKDEYNLIIPESGIYLTAPDNGSIIDLNDLSKEDYLFTWDNCISNGAKLIISTTKDLKLNVQIDAGTSNSFNLSSDEADKYFSQLNIKAGEEAMLYWTIKDSKNLTAAASDIRNIYIKRMVTKLLSPFDLTKIDLKYDKPDEVIQFEWDTTGLPESSKYTLCLSSNPNMKEMVSYDMESNNGKSSVSHETFQSLIEKLPIKRYKENTIYWNIKTTENQFVSRTSGVLNITEMMRFIDVRGDEKNTYRVTRINFSDGTSQVWLAENLRTQKYPDGRDIEPEFIFNTPETEPFGPAKSHAYGTHYHYDIRNSLAPNGWHLPTKQEFEYLHTEASFAEGHWNVLRDPTFFEAVQGQTNLNDWGLSLCASGQWVNDAITNHSTDYCYLLVADDNAHGCLLHQVGLNTLWWPWTTGAPVRFILNE